MRRSLLLVLLLSGCTGGPPPGPDGAVVPTQAFGEACAASLECLSGLCVALADGAAICSRACADDTDCPSGDNWGCVRPEETSDRVCGCVPDAEAEVCGDRRDNDCDGDVDDCRLCDGVAVPEDDPAHCGRCFHVCRADERCDDGACRCAAPGSIACGDGCVDPLVDDANCGACGAACRADQECTSGACGCPAERPTECGGACVDIQTDPGHCGACGSPCPSGQVCRDGACGCADGERDDLCPGIGCVDLGSDEANCGGCGIACAPGQVCSSGTCGCPTDGYRVCGGACIDVRSDTANCGACGTACDPGEVCRDGACRCDSGLSCGGECVAADDAANCGACGRACRADQRCAGGGCVCLSGSECGGACVQLATDENNCGSCSVSCAADQACVSGRCTCDVLGRTYCASAGGCVDLQTEESSCGACGNACPAAQVCSAGRCVCAEPGRTYCASVSACVDVQTDVSNCGACGNACLPSQVCEAGRCTCPVAGERYCAGAGECVPLGTDSNCASCGNACASPTTCRFGRCRCPVSGETYCASLGACVALSNDPTSCGYCGRACPTGATCSGGSCQCPTGESACAGACVDTQTDANHCGACGAGCAAPRTCDGGGCFCPRPTSASELRVSTTAGDSAEVRLASNGSHVAVVWKDLGNISGAPEKIWFQLLNADGTAAQAPVLLASSPRTWTPDISWNGSRWGVVWGELTTASPYRVRPRFQRFVADGTRFSAAVDLGAAPAYGNNFDIRIAHAPGSGWGVVYGPNLVVIGDGDGPFPVPTLLSTSPLDFAGAPDGRFGVVWTGKFQVINGDGSITTPLIRWSTSIGLSGLDLAHDGTSWLLVGAASIPYTPHSIVMLSGPTLGTILTVHSRERYEDRLMGARIALAGDGTATVVWSDAGSGWSMSPGVVYAARVRTPSTGAPTVITQRATLMPLGTVDFDLTSIPAAAHVNPSRFVTVWPDIRWGQREIYAVASDVAACM